MEQARKDREKLAAGAKETREGLEAESNLMKVRMEVAEEMARDACLELERARAAHEVEMTSIRDAKVGLTREGGGGENGQSVGLEALKERVEVMEEEVRETRVRAASLEKEKQSALADAKALRSLVRLCVCVCVCARARVCMCVCERERERERKRCTHAHAPSGAV